MKKTSSRRRPQNDEYQSWDPFTQAKFIYEINRQVGTPITRAEAYRIAEESVTGVDREAGRN